MGSHRETPRKPTSEVSYLRLGGWAFIQGLLSPMLQYCPGGDRRGLVISLPFRLGWCLDRVVSKVLRESPEAKRLHIPSLGPKVDTFSGPGIVHHSCLEVRWASEPRYRHLQFQDKQTDAQKEP